MKKIKKLLCLVFVICFTFGSLGTTSLAAELNDTTISTSAKKFFRLHIDEAGNVSQIPITEEEASGFIYQRGATYAQGWEVVATSGITVAYVTLYYQLKSSSGTYLFDLNNTVFSYEQVNNYNAVVTYKNVSEYSIKLECEYLNVFMESGTKSKTFYPKK